MKLKTAAERSWLVVASAPIDLWAASAKHCGKFDHIFSGPDTLGNFVGQLGLYVAALRAGKSPTARATAGREQVRLDIA